MDILFGSSGVRGLANVEVTPVLACKIGLAVATHAKTRKAVVAHDTRTSGPMLEDALVSGLLGAGATVFLLGIVPTPTLGYMTRMLKADAGFMITASHNPPQYNGIKIFTGEGISYGDEGQDAVERIINSKTFVRADWHKIRECITVNNSKPYMEMIQHEVKLQKQWRLVVDSGCGATFQIAPTIFKNLDCNVTALNAQPDGFFPARSPEPNSESLADLSSVVKEMNADAGIAFDGDGDRVAFIDDKGRFVDFDRVLAAYSAYVVRGRTKAIVVTNVEASMCIDAMVEASGGKVTRTRVGDVYLSQDMKRSNAVFGGEPCGAWIHPQFHYCPDGLLSGVLLLKALETEDKSLSEFIKDVPQYITLRENVACKNNLKNGVMRKIAANLKTIFTSYRDLSTVDGVRLSLETGWILIRASGTEPVIRVTVEGESLKAAEAILKKGKEIIVATRAGEKE